MPDPRRLFGTSVEKHVAQHLAALGYRILVHQFTTPFGEIDLICQDGNEVVFVEVKARTSSAYGYPEESVHGGKLRKIVRCAHVYLKTWPEDQPWRIDVIAVQTAAGFHLTHVKGVDIPEAAW